MDSRQWQWCSAEGIPEITPEQTFHTHAPVYRFSIIFKKRNSKCIYRNCRISKILLRVGHAVTHVQIPRVTRLLFAVTGLRHQKFRYRGAMLFLKTCIDHYFLIHFNSNLRIKLPKENIIDLTASRRFALQRRTTATERGIFSERSKR